ncbi:hypothetical protein [Symmachiella dynata]|uniref:hypothetical protein n=1 Tax=Symmachiella dynata TaxID=2527995 RepID=UPI0030EB88FD
MPTTTQPNHPPCIHGPGQICPHCEDEYADRLERNHVNTHDGPRLRRERPILQWELCELLDCDDDLTELSGDLEVEWWLAE